MSAKRVIIPEKAVMWLGHYSTVLMLGTVAAVVADDVTGQRVDAIGWIMAVMFAAWIAALFADSGCHQERLCERCIAASPLDPQAVVTRWHQALRLHHQRHARAVLFGSVIAWDFVTGSLFHRLPAWVLAGNALTVVIIGASHVVTWQHRRLHPWCPFCGWDEGGEHEVSPDVPAPAATR